MEQKLLWISFIRSIRDTHYFELWSIIGDEKLLVVTNYEKKKKRKENIFLLSFGLFVLYENKFAIMFEIQKEW